MQRLPLVIQSGRSPMNLSASDPPLLCCLVPCIILVLVVVLVCVDLRPPICPWTAGGSGLSAAQRLWVSTGQVGLAK
jgi:hypothetical protein